MSTILDEPWVPGATFDRRTGPKIQECCREHTSKVFHYSHERAWEAKNLSRNVKNDHYCVNFFCNSLVPERSPCFISRVSYSLLKYFRQSQCFEWVWHILLCWKTHDTCSSKTGATRRFKVYRRWETKHSKVLLLMLLTPATSRL